MKKWGYGIVGEHKYIMSSFDIYSTLHIFIYMKKCKNIECNNVFNGKNVYCSLTCRNYYVNKYMRDYNKNSKGMSKKYLDEYENNPNYCNNLNCKKKLPYIKKNNKFCNHSCSAQQTNKIRVVENRTFTDIGIKNIIDGVKKRFNCNVRLCKYCDKKLVKRKVFCDRSCKSKFYNDNKTEYEIYRLKCDFKFNLGDYPDEFDFNLVESNGWYSPVNGKNNLNGVSRDHMISVKYGFENNIDYKIISHPANCKLLLHNDNVSKNKKCSIDVNSLLDRIKLWDIKYGVSCSKA